VLGLRLIRSQNAMAQLIDNQPFHGFTFDRWRYDCGDKAGYVQADLAILIARSDIGPGIRDFVTNLLAR
jgi:UTP--glucose-1-phosphate uridylyltransferase